MSREHLSKVTLILLRTGTPKVTAADYCLTACTEKFAETFFQPDMALKDRPPCEKCSTLFDDAVKRK